MAWPGNFIYYATETASADVTDGTDNSNTLEATEPASGSVTANLGGGETADVTTFTAVDNDPNLTSWDAGDYIAQVNVESLGADVTWGIEINRVNAAGTNIESLASSGNIYSATGVQTLTWANASAKAVSAGDRLQIVITASRAASHGNQACDVAVGTGVDSTTTKINVPQGASQIVGTTIAGSATVSNAPLLGAGVLSGVTIAGQATVSNALLRGISLITGATISGQATVSNAPLLGSGELTGVTIAGSSTVSNAALLGAGELIGQQIDGLSTTSGTLGTSGTVADLGQALSAPAAYNPNVNGWVEQVSFEFNEDRYGVGFSDNGYLARRGAIHTVFMIMRNNGSGSPTAAIQMTIRELTTVPGDPIGAIVATSLNSYTAGPNGPVPFYFRGFTAEAGKSYAFVLEIASGSVDLSNKINLNLRINDTDYGDPYEDGIGYLYVQRNGGPWNPIQSNSVYVRVYAGAGASLQNQPIKGWSLPAWQNDIAPLTNGNSSDRLTISSSDASMFFVLNRTGIHGRFKTIYLRKFGADVGSPSYVALIVTLVEIQNANGDPSTNIVDVDLIGTILKSAWDAGSGWIEVPLQGFPVMDPSKKYGLEIKWTGSTFDASNYPSITYNVRRSVISSDLVAQDPKMQFWGDGGGDGTFSQATTTDGNGQAIHALIEPVSELSAIANIEGGSAGGGLIKQPIAGEEDWTSSLAISALNAAQGFYFDTIGGLDRAIKTVRFKIWNEVNYIATIEARILELNGSLQPAATAATSDNEISSFTDNTWIQFDFATPFIPDPSKRYAVVVFVKAYTSGSCSLSYVNSTLVPRYRADIDGYRDPDGDGTYTWNALPMHYEIEFHDVATLTALADGSMVGQTIAGTSTASATLEGALTLNTFNGQEQLPLALWNNQTRSSQFTDEGQEFTLPVGLVKAVGLRFQMTGGLTCTTDLTLEIRELVGGLPTGTVLATSNTYNYDADIHPGTSSPIWHNFYFPTPYNNLSERNVGWVLLKTNPGGDNFNMAVNNENPVDPAPSLDGFGSGIGAETWGEVPRKFFQRVFFEDAVATASGSLAGISPVVTYRNSGIYKNPYLNTAGADSFVLVALQAENVGYGAVEPPSLRLFPRSINRVAFRMGPVVGIPQATLKARIAEVIDDNNDNVVTTVAESVNAISNPASEAYLEFYFDSTVLDPAKRYGVYLYVDSTILLGVSDYYQVARSRAFTTDPFGEFIIPNGRQWTVQNISSGTGSDFDRTAVAVEIEGNASGSITAIAGIVGSAAKKLFQPIDFFAISGSAVNLGNVNGANDRVGFKDLNPFSTNHYLSAVEFRSQSNVGSPTYNLRCRVQELDGSDDPGTSVGLSTNSFNQTTWPIGVRRFKFDGLLLEAGKKYAFMLEPESGGAVLDGSNYIRFFETHFVDGRSTLMEGGATWRTRTTDGGATYINTASRPNIPFRVYYGAGATLTSSASDQIDGQPIAGTSTASATLVALGELAGSAAGTSTASATVEALGELEGSAAGTATTNGTMVQGQIQGQINGTSTASGSLTASGELVGSDAGTSTASATLGGTANIEGTAAGTVTTSTGALTGSGQLAGGLITGAATVNGNLEAFGELDGVVIEGTSTVSGSMVQGQMQGQTIAGTSTASATINGIASLEGSAAGTSTANGTMVQGQIQGFPINGTSTASATVEALGALQGTATGSATSSATGALKGKLEGTAAAISTATASMVATGSLEGSAAGTSFAQAATSGTALISGTIAATSTATASIRGIAPIQATATGQAAVSDSVLEGLLELIATASGSSVLSATMQANGLLAGLAGGTTTATALLSFVGLDDLRSIISRNSIILKEINRESIIIKEINRDSVIGD